MDRISKLKEYLQGNPDDSFLNHAMALEYIKIGEDGLARELFEGIIARDPGYVGTYYHLAKLYEREQVERRDSSHRSRDCMNVRKRLIWR